MAAALLLAAAGCFAAARVASGPPRFDHVAHAKRDIVCLDCHEQARSQAKAGMPKAELCASCHDPKTDKPAIAASVASYATSVTASAWPSSAVAGATYRDVIFSHARHATAKVDCAACHGLPAKAGETAAMRPIANPAGPMAMDACVACHRERGAGMAPARKRGGVEDAGAPREARPSGDCATCHSALRKDARPPSHAPGWTLQHGTVSRMPDRSAQAERCEVCHARADCDRCHAEQAPRDHTNPFRTSAHGLAAAMDRSRCIACHREDSCDRCHEATPPRSHTSGFGAPQDRHCISCHLPSGGSGCVTCHKGTPSHGLAPPKPPTVSAHRPGTQPEQCLACHRRISHPVTLDSCNLCHH